METESSCPENAANIENHQPLTARERLELFKQQKFQKKNEKAGKVGDKQPVARKALQQRSMQEDNKIGTKIDKNSQNMTIFTSVEKKMVVSVKLKAPSISTVEASSSGKKKEILKRNPPPQKNKSNRPNYLSSTASSRTLLHTEFKPDPLVFRPLVEYMKVKEAELGDFFGKSKQSEYKVHTESKKRVQEPSFLKRRGDEALSKLPQKDEALLSAHKVSSKLEEASVIASAAGISVARNFFIALAKDPGTKGIQSLAAYWLKWIELEMNVEEPDCSKRVEDLYGSAFAALTGHQCALTTMHAAHQEHKKRMSLIANNKAMANPNPKPIAVSKTAYICRGDGVEGSIRTIQRPRRVINTKHKKVMVKCSASSSPTCKLLSPAHSPKKVFKGVKKITIN